MKGYAFYKWYGIIITVLIQIGFVYTYDVLEISTMNFWYKVGFVALYQGIFIFMAISYILLVKAYKKFKDMKKKQEEEAQNS